MELRITNKINKIFNEDGDLDREEELKCKTQVMASQFVIPSDNYITTFSIWRILVGNWLNCFRIAK